MCAEWMVRLLNVCLSSGSVPSEWKIGCIVPLYKGKGDRLECKNNRGISLLSIPGKVYGRILIERVIENSEGQVGEEQSGFRKGRSCADQIFVLRQVCEKMKEKKRKVWVAFMDLEKAYDRVDREAMWQVMRIYGDKRLRIDVVVLKNMLEDQEVNSISWVGTAHQLADCLTKRGASARHLRSVISRK